MAIAQAPPRSATPPAQPIADSPGAIDWAHNSRGLAHAAAHDIRSPLATIQMCAESLYHSGDDNSRRHYAAIIADQARAIAWTLEYLLTLADDNNVSAAPLTEQLDLVPVVCQALNDMSQLALSREVELELDAPQRVVVAGVRTGLLAAFRASAHALVSTLPPRCRLTVSIAGPQGGSDGVASVHMLATPLVPDVVRPLHLYQVPWQRLSLLAAQRLFSDQQATLHPVTLTADCAVGLRICLVGGSRAAQPTATSCFELQASCADMT